jgi:hypothetical protein
VISHQQLTLYHHGQYDPKEGQLVLVLLRDEWNYQWRGQLYFPHKQHQPCQH